MKFHYIPKLKTKVIPIPEARLAVKFCLLSTG